MIYRSRRVNLLHHPYAGARGAPPREETRRLLAVTLAKSHLLRVRFQKNVYASAIGLYKDSMIMQSAKPSNSDFWRSFNIWLIHPAFAPSRTKIRPAPH